MTAQTESISSPTAAEMKSGQKYAGQTLIAKHRTNTIAIDFETAYSATYSVAKMGTWAYVNDPRFRATQVAAFCDQYSQTSNIARFPWPLLHGTVLIAHNAAFDKAVFDRLQQTGEIPADIKPARWLCSSALSRYCNGPSSLQDCARAWLGIEMDKSIRDRMAGDNLDLFDDVAAYALEDARVCWLLWKNLEKAWPENERRVYEETRRMSARGVCIDTEYVASCCATLAEESSRIVATLPWAAIGKPALSAKSMIAWCESQDIEPPPATAKTSTDLEKWRTKNPTSPAIPWLDGMQRLRSLNRTLRVFQAMASRIDTVTGRMPYDLRYCGATTGRWTGAGGLNMQNFNRDEVAEGIDLRNAIVAAPGHSFIVADYAQIESRVLLWLAGDHDTLNILRTGIDLYEAHARTTMGYSNPRPLKDVDKPMRQMAKARVLGLGYGCGAKKFIYVAKIMGGLDITFNDSTRTVNEYRQSNPLITSLWNRLENAMRRCDGGTYRLPLPSGRRLRYYNVEDMGDVINAESEKGHPEEWYGGKLTENFVSAVARDILADAWMRISAAGYHVVMSVHDELVIECPDESAEDSRNIVVNMMQTAPPWADGLPLSVEAAITKRYEK